MMMSVVLTDSLKTGWSSPSVFESSSVCSLSRCGAISATRSVMKAIYSQEPKDHLMKRLATLGAPGITVVHIKSLLSSWISLRKYLCVKIYMLYIYIYSFSFDFSPS